MAYRKFKADYLFTGYELLDGQHVLITDDKGMVQDIVPAEEAGDEIAIFNGILSPGFVNCHCHLELSHLKNVIPPHTGLIEFLCTVVTKRDFSPEIIQQEISKAEKEMYDNGIVAVGDIGNTADTLSIKNNSQIYWQNFVEVLSFTDARAEENVNHYRNVLKQLQQASNELQESSNVSEDFSRTSNVSPGLSEGLSNRQRSSLVPHSPYSISPKTFELINAASKNQIISIHNQEHPAEDELYKTGGGGYLQLFKIFGVTASPFPITGKSSLQSCLPYFNNGQTILLVHNTCTPEEDIIFANEYASKNNISLVWCLCPNANLYIENKVPPVDLFIKHNCTLVLGTDSYSSNWQLSIIKEVAAVHQHFPKTPLNTLLQWATINGAKALKRDDILGSFEKGKQPGITLIEKGLERSKRIV